MVKLADAGEHDAATILAQARAELEDAKIEPDYFELVDSETLMPITTLNGRPAIAVVGARVGEVRLIDNEPLQGEA